jgi:NAD(P)-dependent dehydrogenase (short-subunit alcohol dehydrogenase family)
VIQTAPRQRKADAEAARIRDANTTTGLGARSIGLELDLANLSSIRAFPARLSDALGDASPAVDVLLCSAQGESPFTSERTFTADGFERHLGVNHLGHFALFAALLPALERAAMGFRVITVSSEAHRSVTNANMFYALDDRLKCEDTFAFERYRIAKVANVLFVAELQRRIEAARVRGSAAAVGLGDPRLDLLAASTPSAETLVRVAAAADSGGDRAKSAGLYVDSQSGDFVAPSAIAADPKLARKLWTLSESLIGSPVLDALATP